MLFEDFIQDAYVTAIAVDNLGNGYIAGSAYKSLGNDTALGKRDAYVRKYNRSGSIEWTRQFGSSMDDDVVGLVVYNDHIYVAGVTQGNCLQNSVKCQPLSAVIS